MSTSGGVEWTQCNTNHPPPPVCVPRCLQKAVEAAIQARQWTKAIQILELQEPSMAEGYYKQVAEHYASIKDYPVAEEYFLKAGLIQEIMDMYIQADHWEEAYAHAINCMQQEDIRGLYVGHAQELEAEGKLREAEKLYVIMEEPDLAIGMYKRAKQYDAMTRLVATYHGDLIDDTHLHLAKVRACVKGCGWRCDVGVSCLAPGVGG